METKKIGFRLVSAVNVQQNPSGGNTYVRKFFQGTFHPEALQYQEKSNQVSAILDRMEISRLEEFLKKYPTQEYYFYTTDEKLHFTFRNMTRDGSTGKILISIHKKEKLVYPEVEKVF